MAASPQTKGSSIVEQQWRAAVVEVELARRDYLEYLRAGDREEAESVRLWLRLWGAERRCDELFRTMDRIAWNQRSNS